MKRKMAEAISGKLSIKELRGEKTKEEVEAIKLLDEWHKNASKRKFFVGDKKRVARG